MLIPWDLDSHHKYKANPGTLSLYGSDVPLALSLPLGLGICAIHFSEKQNWEIKFRYLDDRGLQKLESNNWSSYGIWDLRSWHPIHLNFWDNGVLASGWCSLTWYTVRSLCPPFVKVGPYSFIVICENLHAGDVPNLSCKRSVEVLQLVWQALASFRGSFFASAACKSLLNL